jgi:hypothetical protein
MFSGMLDAPGVEMPVYAARDMGETHSHTLGSTPDRSNLNIFMNLYQYDIDKKPT